MARSHNARALREPEKMATYRGSRSLLATLVMCFTFLCVVLLERQAVETALRDLEAGPEQLSQTNLVVLAQVALVPILCAIAAYAVAAQVIHLLRIALYRRALHQYAGNWLRSHAPLREMGIRLKGTPYSTGGTPRNDQERMLDNAASAERSLILLGAEGAGKTATLHALAFELTQRRALIPLYLRRTPLPILIHCASLSDEATESQAGFVRFLQRQMRTFGTKGLAARLPRSLRRGRVVLLCDGLDELAAPERRKMSETLAGLVTAQRGHTSAMVACELRIYEDEPRTLASLKAFDRGVIQAVKAEDAVEAVQKRAIRGGARRLAANDVRSALESHRLSASIHRPALLAALLGETRETEAWPYGRAELLRSHVRRLCAAGIGTGNDAQAEGNALVLGALAVSLRLAGRRILWIPAGLSLGRVVADWLEDIPPLTPTEAPIESRLIASPEEAESACQAALRSGVLLRTSVPAELSVRERAGEISDGVGVAFANSVLEVTFAAWWLDMMDDGLGRVNAELLYPRWVLPVVLWAGAQRHPADLAARLYRLADTPESTATRAGLPAREAVRPATLALALAALCEGLAGMLARESASPVGSERAADVAQQHLRDLLDDMQRLLQNPDDEDRLRATLEDVERRCGPELVDSITFLARLPQLNRLVRAQLAVLLGLLASPTCAPAVVGLVALLDEPDAVMRQAVNAAVVRAGAVFLEPLQAALRSPSERVRSRAEETLALLGDGAVEAATRSLDGPGAEQRAGAARTLGALHAGNASDALIRRLDDGESTVRVAAARALGQIANGQALMALEQHATSADAALRAAIAQALGQSSDPESLPALLKLLGDTDTTVRAAAASALGVLGDGRAVVPLQERRDDPDPWVQRAVVLALQRLGKG